VSIDIFDLLNFGPKQKVSDLTLHLMNGNNFCFFFGFSNKKIFKSIILFYSKSGHLFNAYPIVLQFNKHQKNKIQRFQD